MIFFYKSAQKGECVVGGKLFILLTYYMSSLRDLNLWDL